jgi:hypothetical protein
MTRVRGFGNEGWSTSVEGKGQRGACPPEIQADAHGNLRSRRFVANNGTWSVQIRGDKGGGGSNYLVFRALSVEHGEEELSISVLALGELGSGARSRCCPWEYQDAAVTGRPKQVRYLGFPEDQTNH